MAHRMSHRFPAFSKPEVLIKKSRTALALLLGITLMLVPPQVAIGQINQQQQEQQQREEQAREQQQREQEQREQQERDRQAREQQQREEQQREEQAREQQQREEQQREQQAREQQQREQEQREQQERDRQAREQQQREEQQREQQAREQQQRERQQWEQQAQQQQREQTPHEQQERQQQLGAASKPSPSIPSTNPLGVASNAGAIHTQSAAPSKPKPVAPDRAKNCKGKDQPCPVCPAGQSPGKNNSCEAVSAAKTSGTAKNAPAAAQACPAGQVWNGVQCTLPGVQQCLPGQSMASASCQATCATATGGAQNLIQILRMARQDMDEACTKNPTGQECQSADSTYQMRLNEYRNFLGGVPTGCTLPDPISI